MVAKICHNFILTCIISKVYKDDYTEGLAHEGKSYKEGSK